VKIITYYGILHIFKTKRFIIFINIKCENDYNYIYDENILRENLEFTCFNIYSLYLCFNCFVKFITKKIKK